MNMASNHSVRTAVRFDIQTMLQNRTAATQTVHRVELTSCNGLNPAAVFFKGCSGCHIVHLKQSSARGLCVHASLNVTKQGSV